MVGGMAKGSGMLRPDMATMLCVLTTDAAVDAAVTGPGPRRRGPGHLQLTQCRRMRIDQRHGSAPGFRERGPGCAPTSSVSAVESACRQLAYEMAADAEGASRVVRLRLTGAPDDEAARGYGRAIADSALVRSSFYGGDPNWGRILAALGTCQVDPAAVSIEYEGIRVADQGVAYPFDDQKLAKLLTGDFVIDIAVGGGNRRGRDRHDRSHARLRALQR